MVCFGEFVVVISQSFVVFSEPTVVFHKICLSCSVNIVLRLQLWATVRIYLYEQIVQWRALKTELNFNRDKELAEFLMGSYLSKRNVVKWYVTVLYRVVIIDDFVYYCHSINVTKNFTS